MAEAQTWATGPSPEQNLPSIPDGPVAHLESGREVNCPVGHWPWGKAGLRVSDTWASGPGENRICTASQSAPVAQLRGKSDREEEMGQWPIAEADSRCTEGFARGAALLIGSDPTPGPVAQLRGKPDPEQEMGQWPKGKANLHSSTLRPCHLSPEKRSPDRSDGPLAHARQHLTAWLRYLGQWPRWKPVCLAPPPAPVAQPTRFELRQVGQWPTCENRGTARNRWASGPPPVEDWFGILSWGACHER